MQGDYGLLVEFSFLCLRVCTCYSVPDDGQVGELGFWKFILEIIVT